MNLLIRNLEQRDRLSDDEKRVLTAICGPEREIGAGDDMVRGGDRPWQSILLLEGFAARYKLDGSGRRQITSLQVAGDFVDLHSFLLKTMDHSVLALTPCLIAPVSHDDIQAITTDHPHLARLLWLSTLIDGAVFRQWLALMHAPARRRAAHLICEIFIRLQAVDLTDGQDFAFPMSQADFGDMLGMSTVHMNRVIGQLRREDLIAWRSGAMTIRDWNRLQQAAEFDPTYLNLQNEPR